MGTSITCSEWTNQTLKTKTEFSLLTSIRTTPKKSVFAWHNYCTNNTFVNNWIVTEQSLVINHVWWGEITHLTYFDFEWDTVFQELNLPFLLTALWNLNSISIHFHMLTCIDACTHIHCELVHYNYLNNPQLNTSNFRMSDPSFQIPHFQILTTILRDCHPWLISYSKCLFFYSKQPKRQQIVKLKTTKIVLSPDQAQIRRHP